MTSRFVVGTISTAASQLAAQALAQVLSARPPHADWPSRLPAACTPGQPGHTPLLAFTRMLSQTAQESGRQRLGLEMARLDVDPGDSIFGELIATATTLGEALAALVAYFPVGQTGTTLELTQARDLAHLCYEIRDPTVSGAHRLHDAVYTLGKLTRSIRRILDGRWQLELVSLAMPGPIDTEAYRRFFRAPVVFGSPSTGLHFQASELRRALASADPQRHRHARARLQARMPGHGGSQLLTAALRSWFTWATADGRATLEQAAQDFGVTPRTLQRRLKAQGVGFQDVLNQVRIETARRMLLESQIPVTEIAQQLGFSETSAFTRAFRSHVNMSPRAFRQHGQSAR